MEQPKPGLPVKIAIGDKELTLRYPLKVMKELDADHGISVLSGLENLSKPDVFGKLLYYGVKTSHPDVSLEWIEENVDATMLLTLAPYIAYACSGRWRSIDEAEQGIAKNELSPGVNGTPGLPSGPLPDTISGSTKPISGT